MLSKPVLELALSQIQEKICLQTQAPTVDQREAQLEAGYNCVQGTISAIAYFGNETHYHVKLDDGMTLKVARTNAARHETTRLAREQRVFAWWDGSDIVVLTN